MTHFPEEIVERILSHVTSNRDRNSASLVCKSWYKVDRYSRHSIFIRNCYALRPERLIRRFPVVRSLTLKGKPKFVNSNSVPRNWGGSADQWVVALAKDCPNLEELRLKRMVLSDQTLPLISTSFPNFKSLVLISCLGLRTDGLAAIAANCRFLEHLDLQRTVVSDDGGQWLSCFPESFNSLVSLNFACLNGAVNFLDLKNLVARCRNLRSLRLNMAVPPSIYPEILERAPQIVELGIWSWVPYMNPESYTALRRAFRICKSIRALYLSGVMQLTLPCSNAISPICSNLISLDMSSLTRIQDSGFINLIKHCRKLQCLWILASVGDKGLAAVASTCKDLRELRLFGYPSINANGAATEEGLVAISTGCPKLHTLQFTCRQMTNSSLITVANNCPGLTRFRLYILNPREPDHITLQPLDEGFGEIVRLCKGLRQLALSGLLTDQVFLYIGMYAEQLETLSAPFSGNSDSAMLYVLRGCGNLRKLELKDCPFGDTALLGDVPKYETMRFLWMSSCKVSLGGCKALAKMMPLLNVEIINRGDQVEDYPDDNLKVHKLYVYRTLDGPREDAPASVWTL